MAPILRVDGVAIVSLRPATRVGEEWFVPLAPIADAVGATLSVIPGSQGFRVLRRDGVIVDYDSGTGRFRQGNMLVGELQDFRQVQITGPVGSVLFPLTGAVILLGVTVREDVLANVLEIESLPAVSGSNANGPRFQASKLDYLYSLTTTGQNLGQYLNLNGEALLGTDRLSGTLMLNQVPGSAVPELRQASVRLDLPHRRAISLGDQGTGVGLEAMSNGVRGVGYEQPLGPFQAVFHVGLAASSVNAALGSSGSAVYGSTFADFGLRRRFHTAARRRPDLFFAGNSFRGASRNGATFGVGYSDLVLANQFRVQALVGSFSGDSDRQILLPVIPGVGSQGAPADPATSGTAGDGIAVLESRPIHVQGTGYGFSISDSINPFRNKWTLMGSWELYSRNFLTVQAFSRFSAVKRRSVSTALQPVRYLSFSAAISDSAYTLGIPERVRGYNYGGNVSLPMRIPLQLAYFHTSQTYSGLSAGRFDMAQYSLQLPHLERYSAGAAFSEFRFNGQTGHIANGTLSASMEQFGRMGFHYQSQLRSNTNAGMDWSRDFGKKKDSYIRAGVERQTARGQTTIFAPVISARLPLPRGQTLTLSYMSIRGWSIFQLALGGSLLGHRQMLQVDGVGVMLVQASLSGQVYWDTNANGKFDAAVDRPLPPLQVSLDGEHTTGIDASGYFRFDHVNPGTHRLRVAMENVPARLVFADGEEHMTAVIPYRENRRDFRAVEAGQIRGRVMLVQEGFFAKEPPLNPLPDAHILTSRDRDTFSEGDGTFLLGDLAPGTYVVRLDPASVPRGLVPAPASRSVQVKAGQAIDGVEFRLARPVIEKLHLPEVPEVSHNVAPAPRELPADPDPGAIKETTVAVYPGKLARGDLDVVRPASIQGKVTGPPDVPVDNIVMRMAATGRHTTPDNERNFYFYNLREGENVKPPLPKVVAPLPQTTPPANGKEARPMGPTQSSDAQAAAREHNLIGRQLTQAGNYRGAIAELSEAIRIAPDFALAYNARGYAWFLLRNHAAAIEDLTWAIRLNPNYANAYQTRGKAKKAAGDLSGAAADLRLAKELAH